MNNLNYSDMYTNYPLDKANQVVFGCVGKLVRIKEMNKYKLVNIEDANLLECDNKKIIDFDSVSKNIKDKLTNFVIKRINEKKEKSIPVDELKKKINIVIPNDRKVDNLWVWLWNSEKCDIDNYMFDYVKFKFTIKNVNVQNKDDNITVFTRYVVSTGFKNLPDVKSSSHVRDF